MRIASELYRMAVWWINIYILNVGLLGSYSQASSLTPGTEVWEVYIFREKEWGGDGERKREGDAHRESWEEEEGSPFWWFLLYLVTVLSFRFPTGSERHG